MDSKTVTTLVSSDDSISPTSSKTSRPSIASGELGDISSLSRSSGDRSSENLGQTAVPAKKKSPKSPSASSSYNPDRNSIGDYMKRLSTFSYASTINPGGDDVPLHRQRTLSDDDPPAARPSTSAQAEQDHSAGSVAQSEALFSSPSKIDTSNNRTTSTTSDVSIPCAQPPKPPRTSDSSTATSGVPSFGLSPTRLPSFSSDGGTVSRKGTSAKQESFESSRSRSSSGGRSINLFSDTYSSHHSSETSRRSDDGVFRVPSLPVDKVIIIKYFCNLIFAS